MTVRVVIGTILVVATMFITSFVLLSEPARMTDFADGYKGRSIEAGAAIFSANCALCHGANGEGSGRAPTLNTQDLLGYTAKERKDETPSRLKEIGWSGTPRDYVLAAVSGGRPRASVQFSTYAERMPTWSSQFGGPLRQDQIINVVDFVMNWKADAPVAPLATATPNPNAVGTDLNIELPKGDAANGELLFNGKGPIVYPCASCHALAKDVKIVGPSLFGMATTAATRKAGYDATKYIHESIVLPNDYIVEGFASPSAMPITFAQQMTKQDLADIIAFLLTQK